MAGYMRVQKHTGGEAMKGSLLSLSVLILASLPMRAQVQCHVSADIDFVNYLVGNNMSREAMAYVHGSAFAPSDTLTYLKAWTAYSAMELDSAAELFTKVPASSCYYDKSFFYGVVSHVHQGRYRDAMTMLEGYKGGMQALRSYQAAGVSMLMGDRAGAVSSLSDIVHADVYALQTGRTELENILAERFDKPSRSPVLAAAMSAVIPGSGKIYAGRLDEGISSLLGVGVLAALTTENWVKCGPGDWKTILFGALGSILYIGNIYGSYMSVGIINDNLHDAQNTAIVYNLHIPLRSIFD